MQLRQYNAAVVWVMLARHSVGSCTFSLSLCMQITSDDVNLHSGGYHRSMPASIPEHKIHIKQIK